MPGHETGQSRAVLRRAAMEVRAKMAEFDMEAQRAEHRARLEREEQKKNAEEEFEAQMELAKSSKSTVEGSWNVNGTWEVSCPYIDEGWDFNGRKCNLRIGTIKPNAQGKCQMYADFNFNILTGIMRFVLPNTTSTATTAADFLLQATDLPSSSNKTVNFRWRGEDIGTNEMQLYSDEQSCSMTFHSPNAFTGTFKGDLVDTVTFEGFEVNDQGSRSDPEYAWESRDEEVYESARVGRWR